MLDLRPISSCKGAIRHLLLAFTGAPSNAKLYFAGLLEALPQDVDLTILVHELEGDDFQSQRGGVGRLEKVLEAFEDVYPSKISASTGEMTRRKTAFMVPQFSPKALLEQLVNAGGPGLNSCLCLANFKDSWHGHREYIQDPFVVLQSEQGAKVLLEPLQAREFRPGYQQRSTYMGDAFVAECLASEQGYLLRPSKVTFEGGDVLVCGRRLLVGRDVVERALAEPGRFPDRGAVVACLLRDFGVEEVVEVGHEEHELPFGRGLGYQPFYHLDLYLTVASDEGELLLAEPELLGEASATEETELLRLQESLDEVQAQLLLAGFSVQRVPLGIDLDKRSSRILSFNNVLVECLSKERRVYLPVYKDKEDVYGPLQRRAKRAWKSCGFQVREVDGPFVCLADEKASLHCIAKVLERA